MAFQFSGTPFSCPTTVLCILNLGCCSPRPSLRSWTFQFWRGQGGLGLLVVVRVHCAPGFSFGWMLCPSQSLAVPSGQLVDLLNPIHLPPMTLSAWVQAAFLAAGATKSPRP